MADIELAASADFFNSNLLPCGVIHWSEAKNHLGEAVKMYGEVAATYFDYDDFELAMRYPELKMPTPPTFLEIGAKYPNKELVKLVIWGENRDCFEKSPDYLYKNRAVVFSGKPYTYKGLVHVKISAPSDITIVEPIQNLYSRVFKYDIDSKSEYRPVFSNYDDVLTGNMAYEPTPEEAYESAGLDYYKLDLGTHVEYHAAVGDFIIDDEGEYVDPDDYRDKHYRRPY